MMKDRRKKRYKKVGWRLEFMVVEALKELGFPDVFWNQKENGVDVILTIGGIEIECKRHRKTQYVTASWLQNHVVSRYSKNATLKFLVVTKINWNWEGEALLQENGIRTICVGSIDRKYQLEKAKEIFKEQFGRITVFEAEQLCPRVP